MTVKILKGDCREVLRELEPESVHCVVTSPPYWGLRDYGVAGQIGLETTPEIFTSEMVDVFRLVRRALRKDGTCWLNLGDSYMGGGRGGAEDCKQRTNIGSLDAAPNQRVDGYKQKDLVGAPWMVAFALRADGWYLRQDIIWAKPNPMPESVTDRCTKAHEYVFLLSKSSRYHYDADAIKEDPIYSGLANQDESGFKDPRSFNGKHKNGFRSSGKVELARGFRGGSYVNNEPGPRQETGNTYAPDGFKRNKRSVWEIATAPFSEAHFATFPPALIEPCILAGCPKECCSNCGAPVVRDVERESIALRPNSNSIRGYCASSAVSGSPQRGAVASRSTTLGWSPSCACGAGYVGGTVLDPFGGAGTTGLVADRLGRNAILIELNPEYAAMAERRIKADAGMFASVE